MNRMKTLETQEKKNIDIRHRAQQHIARSYSSKQHCIVRRTRRSASVLYTSYADSH